MKLSRAVGIFGSLAAAAQIVDLLLSGIVRQTIGFTVRTCLSGLFTLKAAVHIPDCVSGLCFALRSGIRLMALGIALYLYRAMYSFILKDQPQLAKRLERISAYAMLRVLPMLFYASEETRDMVSYTLLLGV